jgi:SAM-dependent methyltransferase
MLERAKAKAGDLPIRWVEADERSFHLERRFALIFECGSVFMHMLARTEQEAFLARAREHLAPGGRFVISLLFPHPEDLASDPEDKAWLMGNIWGIYAGASPWICLATASVRECSLPLRNSAT